MQQSRSAFTQIPNTTVAAKNCGQQTKRRRILLAEDNQINQIVASDLLTNAGYAIDVVGDGQSAVDALRNGKYDLVLMDCQMPVMDGLDATRVIRKHEEHHQVVRIPIIALTANASNVDRSRCAEAAWTDTAQAVSAERTARPGAKYIADSNHKSASDEMHRNQNSLIAGRKPRSLCDRRGRPGFRPRLSKNLSSESTCSQTNQYVSETHDPLRMQTLLDSCTQNSALAMRFLRNSKASERNQHTDADALQANNAAELAACLTV